MWADNLAGLEMDIDLAAQIVAGHDMAAGTRLWEVPNFAGEARSTDIYCTSRDASNSWESMGRSRARTSCEILPR